MENAIQKKSPLISANELAETMNEKNVVLIDARTGPGAKEKYSAEHLKGAQFVDLEKDLSKKTGDPANGGRHPLPDINEFVKLLGNLGIEKDTHVVVYDDKAGANAAARFWWLMKAVGHKDIQVLDGGFKAALEQGLAVTNILPTTETLPAYPANDWVLPTVDAGMVAKVAADPDSLVIDVREAYRFRGESEPFDPVAGHIPGAVNIPYTSNMDDSGHFLTTAELSDKYKKAIGDRNPKQVIVHCGSGVTACHTLLAMEQAGMETPNLYVGSWSEWSGSGRPVAVGEQ